MHGWEPGTVAHEALDAVAEWMRGGGRDGTAAEPCELRRVDFVLRGDAAWEAFRQRALALFGERPKRVGATLTWFGVTATAPSASASDGRRADRQTRRSRNTRRSAAQRRTAVAEDGAADAMPALQGLRLDDLRIARGRHFSG